jgi:hypothetical protein
MRGFPLLRLVFVTAALALLAVPVWMLTREKPAEVVAVSVPASSPEKTADYRVTLTASSPASLRVMAANQPTASSDGAVSVFETGLTMNAAEPEDLAIFADFADKTTPQAVRVRVDLEQKALADTTLWGTGLVEDVVEIPAP